MYYGGRIMEYEELKVKLNKLLHSKWLIVLIIIIIICSIFYYLVVFPTRISALEGVKEANKKAKSWQKDACLASLSSDPYNTKEGKSNYWTILYFSPSSNKMGKFGKKDVIEYEQIEITVYAKGQVNSETRFSPMDLHDSINLTMDSTDAFNIIKKNSTYKKFIKENPLADCSMFYPWDPGGGSNSSFFGWSIFFKQNYGPDTRFNKVGLLINATTGNISIAVYHIDEEGMFSLFEIFCYLTIISIAIIVVIFIVFLFNKQRKKRPPNVNSTQNYNQDSN
jgi:preprotein translocase subunit YajC